MAMIDYGAIVIKNGRIINRNEFFQDMKREVGWTDDPFRERYPDCDCFDELGPLSKRKAMCNNCPRAKHSDEVISDDKKEFSPSIAISDCKGFPLEIDPKTNIIDGNYFAYIGDEELVIGFYKTIAFIYDGIRNKSEGVSNYSFDGEYISRKVIKMDLNGARITIRKIGSAQYMLHMIYKENNYRVIYGYGIDSNIDVFNKTKNIYLGKWLARKITAIINHWTKDFGMEYIIDEENNWTYFRNNYKDLVDEIIDRYDLNKDAYDYCGSLKDFVDMLNMYYGFAKFGIRYLSDIEYKN